MSRASLWPRRALDKVFVNRGRGGGRAGRWRHPVEQG